jgi:hypothetical protein
VLLPMSNRPVPKLVGPIPVPTSIERGDISFPGLMVVYTDCIVCHYICYTAMFSKMHPELDPLGSDLRKYVI